MRVAAAPGTIIFLCLAGCGYVGPVLPPSPELPQAVTDLVVVERGDQLLISFNTPPRTTDNIPVETLSKIDLRIGLTVTPFDFNRWAASATPYELEPPAPSDPENPVSVSLSKTVAIADWVGKRVAIAVRTAVKKNDHYSSWSNRVVLDVIPALSPPVVKAQSTAKGVLLTWPSEGGALGYRIYRKGAAEATAVELGTSNTHDFLDSTSQYETPYQYTVVAARGLSESLPSEPAAITTTDIFPPSVPSSITALAGPSAIEVSWQRSTEPDLKGYFVYRSVNSAPFEAVGGLLTVPAYSDRNVEHGKIYRYQVSAVDQKNNASERSVTAEVSY
ncbi:MAG: hypothetical protein M3Y72_10255 [Acidobacteriota bacterium]|nr:hypothetical protein [Acidobacteriota bacterium]